MNIFTKLSVYIITNGSLNCSNLFINEVPCTIAPYRQRKNPLKCSTCTYVGWNAHRSKLYNMIYIKILINDTDTSPILIMILQGTGLLSFLHYINIISFLGIKGIQTKHVSFWLFGILFRSHNLQNDVIT